MTTERPILFSAPMVRALLAGTKTQTRRVVKDTGLYAVDAAIHGPETASRELLALASRCPYGKPGDRLWVREGFSGPHCMEAAPGLAAVPPSKWGQGSRIWYWADGNPEAGDWTKPRPGMFMPRWASRILLEVTKVRVERLQAISEADAMAEGAAEAPMPMGIMYSTAAVMRTRYREGFGQLWCDINGAHSWDANPWVWAVSFKRVEVVHG